MIEMETQQIKTFRDFLHFYNVMSEMCFQHCVTDLNSRHMTETEEKCVDQCSSKFIYCNNRLIKVYAEVQETIVARRLKDMEEEHAKQQAAVAAAASNPQELNTHEITQTSRPDTISHVSTP